MGRKTNKKLYQFVDALVVTGSREIVSAGLTKDEDQARLVAHAIARSICNQFARSLMYVPLDVESELAARDQEIWEKYTVDGPDGARKYSPVRIAQLAEEYKLTVAHLYCIVREGRKRQSAELQSRQGRLPGLDDDDEGPTAADLEAAGGRL